MFVFIIIEHGFHAVQVSRIQRYKIVNTNKDYWSLLKTKVNKSSLAYSPLLRNTMIVIVYHLMNLYLLGQFSS